ncbi:MMPL family transporter [Thermomonospora catenispora]|uniref:MMPL family transporter n=1 Tax=Thermomonospora catenispora TaxID=2493090 RepID=UPI0011233B23|nr:MMPL family transporter [Thermomonospora catenispora]TNY38412.1 MMPL family transporter [Thermomonospora catenispora]
MLERWGRFTYRRRWLVLATALAAVIFSMVWGTGVFGAMTSADGFATPDSESARAIEVAERALPRGEADVVVLYTDRAGRTVDDPAVRKAVTDAVAALPPDRVASSLTYYSTGSPQFVSADRTTTYAVLRLAGEDTAQREENYKAIRDDLTRAEGLKVTVGGAVPTTVTVNERVSEDIARAEMLSLPILLVLLVVIFGGLAAAALPLLTGMTAILGTFTVLHAIALATDLSIFAVNVATFLGLGLAIDYGLFMVARFREELRRAPTVEDALGATMATAGRTVLISGITVAISMGGLILFPQIFLKSMGYGGVATVLVDMVVALTVLPATLAVLGPRVNALSLRRRVADPAVEPARGGWHRAANAVMRRPVLSAAAAVALLLAIGAPFLHISWGGVDTRVLPEGAEVRVAGQILERDFPGNATSPIDVVVEGRTDPAALAERLRQVPGVTGATVTGQSAEVSRIALTFEGDVQSDAARDLVERIRQMPAPPGTTIYVGGATATVIDQLDSLADTLPRVALAVGTAIFVLLFLAFGSVVLPVKAIAVNLLSLAAAFGAVVWIFQDGHLSGLLDFTATGTIAPAMPILMLLLLFGVSMDYEVFLLSRVREQYDLTGDNTAAVAAGVQRTGAVITGAALLLMVAIGAMATSGVSFIKLIGVGMAIAIALDATVVRLLLVPAAMRLLGRANWWAPGPLARLYRRYGIREEEDPRRERDLIPA